MSPSKQLFLHEEIMLLALKDESGTIASGTSYQFALAGAALAELLLNKRIQVETVKKKKYAQLVDTAPLGDPVLDECLGKVVDAKKRQQLQTWVSRFSGLKNLKNRVAQSLVRRGILRADEDKVLLLFTRKIFPEVNPEPERKLIKRLREAIFSDKENIDPRTVVLLSIAKSADLLKVVFDKKALKDRKGRIEQVVNGELSGKATKEAIEAMQAAVMVAVIIPAVVSTSVTAGH
jgi:Golgi phosphoprotein 3